MGANIVDPGVGGGKRAGLRTVLKSHGTIQPDIRAGSHRTY